MYLRECTIPSKIRSFAFELLELVARPKGAFVFSKGCGVTSTRIAGCGAGTGADMRAHARRSLASQDRTRLPPAHLGVAAPRGVHHLPRGCHDRGQQDGPNAMVARVESTLRMKVHDPVSLALNQLSI